MKRIILTVILSAVLLCGCGKTEPILHNTTNTGTADASYKQITQDEASSIMQSETDYIILDVRTQAEYEQGHIPGAICIPNESITDKPIDELPDKNLLILVYCRSGRRSKEASQKLADMGYLNVMEFGGIIDWNGEIEYP